MRINSPAGEENNRGAARFRLHRGIAEKLLRHSGSNGN